MENVIEIRNLHRQLTKNCSFENFNLDIKNGYVTGLIGANGAGKTSLIKLVMGLYVKKMGEIRIFGLDAEKDYTKVRQKIGYVPDEPAYIDGLSLRDNVNLIKPFYPTWSQEQYEKYEKEFDLNPYQDFDDLSKGMKTKFSLAIALGICPDLLILDEPTAGIDPIARREILNMLYDFTAQGDKSVVLSTHVTSDLDKIADYIIFLQEGQVLLDGVKDDVLTQYMVAKGENRDFTDLLKSKSVYYKQDAFGFEALVKNESEIKNIDNVYISKPTIEDIMYFYGKKDRFSR